MPICPHCQTTGEQLLVPCPTGDGFFLIEDESFAAHKGDEFLGRHIADRFVVTNVLGRGSMGRVYKAHQMGVERDVALKLFQSENILEKSLGRTVSRRELEDAQARFIQEAQVLGRLAHPNCVTVFDFGVGDSGDFMYMAMEYVAGVSLREAVNRGLKYAAIMEISRQVLQALQEAHGLGIVHRDLKPENIILSYRFTSQEHVVKVLDFGIAKLLQGGSESRTGAGALFGTPAYMSPEQCRGEVGSIGPSVDVYAFGCMLYEMLCGRLPFQAQTSQHMVQLHQEADVPSLFPRKSIDPPAGLEDYVRRCLQKHPTERFEHAGEALRALDQILSTTVESGLLVLGTQNLGNMADAIRDRSRKGQRPQSSVSVPDDNVTGAELDPVGKFGETPPSGALDVDSQEVDASMSTRDTKPPEPSVEFESGQTRLGDESTERSDSSVEQFARGSRLSDGMSSRTWLVIAAVVAVTVFAVLVFYLIYMAM